MQALWGEPWTVRSVSVDGNEVVRFRGDVTDLSQLATQCTVTVKARPGREKTKWRCRPGFSGSSVLTARIRFIALVVFSVLSCTFSEHCPKKSLDQSMATKVESGISDANRRFLVCESLETGKEGQNACQKKKFRSSLSKRAAEHPMQWVKKQRTGLMNRHYFERKGLSINAKPKEGKVEVRDLRGILVRSSRAQSPAVGRSIYV